MVYPYFKPIAWGAIACLASQASAQYVTIATGTCSSQGYQYIDDINECESAAQELSIFSGGNYTKSHYTGPSEYIPHGCSYLVHCPHGCTDNYLQINKYSLVNDTGSQCGNRFKVDCICKDGIAAVTTSSTMPVTSTTTTTSIQLTTKFLAPTSFTTTASWTSPSCIYTALPDTAVKGRGSGGKKLKRASYKSDADYLDACRAKCNADSTCKGFVDDLTESRSRMCKPKTSAKHGYHKKEKTFYVKGLGC
jgi:hypothetical protein